MRYDEICPWEEEPPEEVDDLEEDIPVKPKRRFVCLLPFRYLEEVIVDHGDGEFQRMLAEEGHRVFVVKIVLTSERALTVDHHRHHPVPCTVLRPLLHKRQRNG